MALFLLLFLRKAGQQNLRDSPAVRPRHHSPVAANPQFLPFFRNITHPADYVTAQRSNARTIQIHFRQVICQVKQGNSPIDGICILAGFHKLPHFLLVKLVLNVIPHNLFQHIIQEYQADRIIDESFDAVTVAFGIRNFEGLDKGLSEMCRVLKTGGHLVILELSTPDRFPMKQLFTIYSKVVIPLLGKCISKDNSAYTYLPESIRAFPQGEVMQGVIRKAGFSEVHFKRLTFGICTLYVATK